ncbi:MAG TPA: hypothetical protein VMX35_09835 [Acidobacteriota bacterium]|nr:hypothetical protein [Acidobacteriota bacterium]
MNADKPISSGPMMMLCAVFLILLAPGVCLAQESEAVAAGAEESLEEQADSVPDSEEIRSIVEAAVAQRIRPLVREIRRLEEQVWLHDILGGIGYIAGLAGVAFYFLGVRRREKSKGDRT